MGTGTPPWFHGAPGQHPRQHQELLGGGELTLG